ncbi:hypothetical protein [Bifidobacterium sp. SMB2]|uniref:hypothetical protein n=1 Tax=Bifidobacterium sp. SMB2 TaxID=2661626 RepID=UPI001EF98AB7|nr:hypothetical protein [Bifidobacterium sp. SMB2]
MEFGNIAVGRAESILQHLTRSQRLNDFTIIRVIDLLGIKTPVLFDDVRIRLQETQSIGFVLGGKFTGTIGSVSRFLMLPVRKIRVVVLREFRAIQCKTEEEVPVLTPQAIQLFIETMLANGGTTNQGPHMHEVPADKEFQTELRHLEHGLIVTECMQVGIYHIQMIPLGLLDQRRQIIVVPHIVSVKEAQILALGQFQTTIASGDDAGVLLLHIREIGMLFAIGCDDFVAVIRGTIVDDDQLSIGIRLIQHAVDALRDIVTVVVVGDDDGDEGVFLGHIKNGSSLPIS